MTRRMQHSDPQAANVDCVPVAKIMIAVLERQSLAVTDFGIGHVLELNRTNNVVFVSMGLKNITDFCAFLLSQALVDLAVSTRVDDHSFCLVGEVVTVVG